MDTQNQSTASESPANESDASGDLVGTLVAETNANPATAEIVNTQYRQQLIIALAAVRDGDFSVRLPADNGLGEIAKVFNEMVSVNEKFADEVDRVSQAVAEEGKVPKPTAIKEFKGSWVSSN